MESYVQMNTEFRKQAKNGFEINFYKLMSDSVFGKTMENVRKRVNIKIVREMKEKRSQTDSESSVRRVLIVFQQSCRLLHAQRVCETRQACLCWDDNSRQQ